MPRSRTIEIGVLNITTEPPHSPERYLQIFQDLKVKKPYSKIYGSECVMFGSMRNIGGNDPINGFCGSLYKFVDIDPHSAWLDIQEAMPVVGKDGEPVFPIPTKLKPNLKEIPYVFYPKGHRMFIVTKSLGKNTLSLRHAERGMLSILSHTFFHEKHGDINVHMEQESDSIEALMQVPNKTSIDIHFTMPNPDDLGDVEERALRRLERQNVKRYNQKMVGNRDNGLNPDEDTRAVMNMSVSNGYTRVVGYIDGTRIVESTRDHPRNRRHVYYPDEQNEMDALIQYSAADLVNLTKRR